MQELALFIYTETSLHAGTGSTVSAVDLPIQRERTTRHPVVQGSGIKGALRSQFLNEDYEKALFGPSTQDMDRLRSNGQENNTYAGAMSVGDARIILFPVQSLNGVFAYTTCPMVLARLRRTFRDSQEILGSIALDKGNALVTTNSAITVTHDQLVLEEFTFHATASAEVDTIAGWLAENTLPTGGEYSYWRDKLASSLVILSDQDFTEFTVNSTEIVTRVRLDSSKKTVEQGALWTQESLPSDTLLMSSVYVVDSRNGERLPASVVTERLVQSVPGRIQIGGDETTGQGFVALRWCSSSAPGKGSNHDQ